ncbi:MAG: MOSC domain-containing protein [Ilumatobacter sp.]
MPSVVAVHRSSEHTFSKQPVESIDLIAGLGVDGDAHMGARVKHRSRVKADPTQPNLRQVHLIASELLDEVNTEGYNVAPGDLGENITTAGIDLINQPVGTSLRIGDAVLTLTGLRNPCVQIDAFATGLQGRMLGRDDDGKLVRKTGVMAVVVRGGMVAVGDEMLVAAPAGAPMPMEKI